MIVHRLASSAAFIQNMDRSLDNEMIFPSNVDLNGASAALTRLQDTYNLDTHALADGEIRGKKYSSPFTGTIYDMLSILITKYLFGCS